MMVPPSMPATPNPFDRFDAPAMGTTEAALRGAERGLSFGFGDELRGLYAGGVDYLRGGEEGSRRYQEAADENRARQAQAEREHPWAITGGEVVGGIGGAVGTGIAGIGARAVGLGARLVRGAVAGGTAGGLYGAGTADGELSERAIGAAKGAAIGAPLGVAAEGVVAGAQAVGRRLLPRSTAAPSTLSQAETSALIAAGLDPAQIGDDAARTIIGRANQVGGVTPETVRQAAAQEFNIPLTRGQATRDVGQAAFEEEARAAARGDPAANILKGFDARQAEAVQGARKGFQDNIAGGAQTFDNVTDIGQGVAGAVRDAERSLNNRVGQAYERAGQTGATISADSIRGLPQRVASVLDDAAIIVDDKLTPATQAALKELSRVADVEGFAASRGVTLSHDATVAGVNLNGLEYIRRRINGLYGGNLSRADRNGLTTVKREFDGWLDEAVEHTLISGDEGALTALKEARALRTEYGRKFEKADRFDDSGGLIQRILRQDVTPGEVANMLFGLGRVGEQGRAYRLAKDLRDVFGPESEGWSAIRQGAWLRMTTAAEGATQPGPKAASERILRFVNGTDGAATSRLLFSEEERQTMTRLARTMQNLVPPDRASNPSGSGFVVARRVQEIGSKLGAMLGFGASGGSVGVAATIGGAVKAGSAARNITKAVQATQPVRVPALSSPAAAIGAGEAGAAYGLPMVPDWSRR